MSKARKRRASIRWARYYNRYSWIPSVVVGGWSAVHAMNVPGQHWRYVRRNRAHPFGYGYKLP